MVICQIIPYHILSGQNWWSPYSHAKLAAPKVADRGSLSATLGATSLAVWKMRINKFVQWSPSLAVTAGDLDQLLGGGPRVVVSTAAFHARVRGPVPCLGDLKETKMFLPHPRVKLSIVGSLRDRELACSASDRQGANFESCVWRTVSSHSSHHRQEILLAQFSLYVHRGGLKPDSFHFGQLFPYNKVISVLYFFKKGSRPVTSTNNYILNR